MKTQAWQFESLGGPEGLSLVDQELAEPGPGEALVRIEAIGLNRSDLAYMAGYYLKQPPSPSFLGQEAVGEVVALGADADGPADDGPGVAGYRPRVGDRVGLLVGRVDYAAMGTYRRHGIYPQNALLPWPRTLGRGGAAALWVAALTAQGGLRTAGLSPETAAGKRVLVTAASSGVGVVALQIARAWGAETFASTTSEAKCDALSSRADHVLHTPDPEALVSRVQTATDDRGVDVAFDPVGFAYLGPLFRAAAVEGQIVSYGIMAGREAAFDLPSMLRKELGVHGFTIYRLLRHPELLAAVVADSLRLVDSGQLDPVIAQEFAFEQAPDALAAMARNAHLGKLVVGV